MLPRHKPLVSIVGLSAQARVRAVVYHVGVEALTLSPVTGPVRGLARVPGSKSITNRALALAALATGTTRLENALWADDTGYMTACLHALGFTIQVDKPTATITVEGRGGEVTAPEATLFVGNSGTTARFITPLAALGSGEYLLDGVPRMRERPLGDLLDALASLGVDAHSVGGNGCPPVRIRARGLHGGQTRIRADKSSQFLSGLLLAAPCASGDTEIILDGPILSAPYIDMTLALVRRFGGQVSAAADGRTFHVPGRQKYAALPSFTIEPDASAASYFWAAAAITNGQVRIDGIGGNALQGDAAFVDLLEQMGCQVTKASGFIEVRGTSVLRGITCDMNAISDTVMTLAAIAPFADSPTTITNVAHIRHKETDRLTATVTELRRLGVTVEERPDGLTIYPTDHFTPVIVETYEDHRMAMAFSLVGLRVPGVQIADPDCVAKTFPGYWNELTALTAGERPLPYEEAAS